eukprot:INCI4975.8.p1 GENE.INCI4975.8~~INCI4975.8.p1  ORF type:complete len:1245 (-),score=228.62 INCI4975.8:2410-6144(-)
MSAFQYPTKPKPENAKYALAEYAKRHGLKRPLYKATVSQAAPSHNNRVGSGGDHAKDNKSAQQHKHQQKQQKQTQQNKNKKVPVGHFKCSVEVGDRVFSSDELYSTTKKAQIAVASLALKRIREGECPTRGGSGGGVSSVSLSAAARHHLALRAKGGSLPLHVRFAHAVLAPSKVPRVAFAVTLLVFLQNLPPHFEYADHGAVARGSGFSLVEDIAGSHWDSEDRGCVGNEWWRPVGVALYNVLGTAPSIVRHLGSALLHSAAVATLAAIVLKIALPHDQRLESTEPLTGESLRIGAAALGSALIFALHPAQTTVLRFAESQHEIFAALLGMLAAYFAVDDVVAVLRPNNGPADSSAAAQHNPHFGSRRMNFVPAVACAVLAPFSGAAGVLGIAVLVFLSMRLKFRIALPTKEAHDLGASMLYVGVMTILVLYAARTLLLERSEGLSDGSEQGGIVQAVFATLGAIIFFPVAALQSVCQVGIWPWVDLLWSITTASSSLSGAASTGILSDPLSLASLALVALSLAAATSAALKGTGNPSASPQQAVQIGSVPPPSQRVQAASLLRDLGLALLLGVPALQFAVVGPGTGAPVCTRWTAAAETTYAGQWNALSLYVPVAGFALVCASLVVGGLPMPFSSSTAAAGEELAKSQLQALAWIAGPSWPGSNIFSALPAPFFGSDWCVYRDTYGRPLGIVSCVGLSLAVIVAASSAHIGIHGGSAIEPGSPLCGAELGLYYQRGWQASRHQSWAVARQAFAFAFSPQCAPNTVQSAALHGFGQTYQQQALLSLESATKPDRGQAAEREQAGRDASERLFSRAAAALRLSCQAFPDSYAAQITLGRLLHDEGSRAHVVEAARCFEAAAHIAAAADVNGRSRPQEYEARELLALARLKVGDDEGAAAALEISDEFTSAVSTPNATYTLALVHGLRLARAAAAGGSLNVKDAAMQRLLHLYMAAAEAGHLNAQSIVAAREAAIASSEESVGSDLDDLDARWWGRHLTELVETVQDYQVTGEAATPSSSLRLSTHLGYPLRSPEADPFLSGPSCHFSVATITVEWTVASALGNATNNATELNVENCVASRVDGCADAIMGDEDIADFVQEACRSHVQNLDASSRLRVNGEVATSNNASIDDGLAASPRQQHRHTFRAYIDHRVPFTVNVDDKRAGHSLLVGYMDDPWAVGAIACQVFVTTQTVVDDVVPGDCERRVRSLAYLYLEIAHWFRDAIHLPCCVCGPTFRNLICWVVH